MNCIRIEAIDLARSPMVRAAIDRDTVDEYAESYQAQVKMPPVHVFQPNGKARYLLADGRHRLEALKKLGRNECLVEVHAGNEDACLMYALISNTTHGKRRSNEDKRLCVKLALAHWPKKTQREIAELVGVSHTMVDKYVKEMSPQESVATVATPQVVTPSNHEKSLPDEPSQKPLTASGGTKPALPQKPPTRYDVQGCPMPEKIVPTFDRIGELKEYVKRLEAIRHELLAKAGDKDVLWQRFDFQNSGVIITNLINNFKFAYPEIVCTFCQGYPETQPNSACPECRGKGLVSTAYYNISPHENKKMRAIYIQKHGKTNV